MGVAMKYGFCALIAAAIATFPLSAQAPQAAAAARVLKSFQDCRDLTGQSAELDCYRAATERLTREVEAKKVTILDRSDVRETRRSLFGFSLPKLKLFGGDNDDDPEFTEIEAKVVRIRDLEYGKLTFTLPDSAVWQTTEPVKKRPSVGSQVRIKQAAMGGYFISFDGGRAIRGMRVK
jgi:hypothetical protein